MINAVIADDSAFLRQVLQEVLEESKKIKVVGLAKNGKEAISLVKALSPDVLILDCEMPVMDGLTALKHIMKEFPLPIFMFSAYTSDGAKSTIEALAHGAVDFLQKPSKGAHELNKVSESLIKKLENIVKHKHDSSPEILQTKPSDALDQLSFTANKKQTIDLIAVGSSTGGVAASAEILKRLPEKTKPIVWVQHMPPNFTKPFAERVDSFSKIKVKEAQDGDILQDNHCYIANGGFQMRVQKNNGNLSLRVADTEKVSGHCPSCNVLFESINQYFSDNVLCVILTGMGDDGTKGLVKLHNQGAFVIGQNEKSCVVYGMPRAAQLAGAVDIQLDITQIADAIIKKSGAFV